MEKIISSFIIIGFLIGCGAVPASGENVTSSGNLSGDMSYEQTTDNGNAVFLDSQGIQYIISMTYDEFSVILNHYQSDYISVKECTVTVHFGTANQDGYDTLNIEVPARYTGTASQQNTFATLSYVESEREAQVEMLTVPEDVNEETESAFTEDNLKLIADEIIARKSEFKESFANCHE